MPSPVSTTANADQPLDTSAHIHQTASSLQNGASSDGAVQQPDAVPRVGATDTTVANQDLIREGKEKAKAIMAASGVAVDLDAAQTSTVQPASSASPANSRPNDVASPSRKRSRSGSRIPSQPPAQGTVKAEEVELSVNDYLLKEAIHRDQLYSDALVRQEEQAMKLLDDKRKEKEFYESLSIQRQQRKIHPGELFGYGYMGYGNGTTGMATRGNSIQYPAQKKKPGGRKSRPLHVTKKDVALQAEQVEELVPIRLDIDLERLRLRDTFTWNLHDRITPHDVFVENLVEDFNMPQEARPQLYRQVLRELEEQLQDYYPHVFIDEPPLDPNLPYMAYKDDEMRILIKLNISIGPHTLVDQFEWDINHPDNSPEEFALQMSRDMALSGEFTTAIAHSIREQTQMFTKALYFVGHPFDGRLIEDADVRDNMLPSPLPSVFRSGPQANEFTPYFYELTEVEMGRTDFNPTQTREQRRQKRSLNRRGGPAIPDLKDRARTVRSLVVSSVIPGAAETFESTQIIKPVRASRRGRRPGTIDGNDDSSESESEESAPESPAPSQVANNSTRTRNPRGAAEAARVSMRNIGRSQTPDTATLLHQHETRTSRRAGTHDLREESVHEPTSLIVKLRISSKKFKEWVQNTKTKEAAPKSVSTTTASATNQTPSRGTPGLNSMPPPPSPAMPARSTPGTGNPSVEASPSMTATPTPASSQAAQWQYYPDGRADAPFPQGATPAPPPSWLLDALADLRKAHPDDLFEATMRYQIIDTTTEENKKLDQIPQNAPLPPNLKALYAPRIRCIDCPGKLYTAGPGRTVDNFETHLRNRQHKINIDRRKAKTGGSGS